MAADLQSWIYRYYIDPIIYDTGYNPVNTVTWAIILSISIIALIKAFRRMSIDFDGRLLASTIPYVLAGASLRVVEDAGLLQPPASYLLITPLIYFLVFAVTSAALLLSRRAFGRDFHRAYGALGLLWFLFNIALLSSGGIDAPWVVAAVIALGSLATEAVYVLRNRLPLSFLDDRYNLAILYAHMLDASSTYVGVDWFGYVEKHVVPTFLIDLAGTAAVMYPLKLMVLLPALALIDGSMEDRSFRNLVKLALIILGLAPALRNTLRLALGV